MESMELDRIVEMDTFIRTYANAVQTLTLKMKEVRRTSLGETKDMRISLGDR